MAERDLSTEPTTAHQERPTRSSCPICGEAIGVYEPTVYASGAFVKRTSLAAEPWLEGSPARTAYHAACWDAHHSGDAAA